MDGVMFDIHDLGCDPVCVDEMDKVVECGSSG